MEPERSILHIDMDAFFASVEQMDNPSLRGKPVLVGYDGPRGVVAAASYEARRFGCHSAQPMAVAKRNCPNAIIVPVRGKRYAELSQRMFAILDRFSPVVEPLSIDEAFVDLTGTEKLLGSAVSVARLIRETIRTELGLTASVGVAPNKFLAKLASDLDKPDGLTVIRAQDVDRVLPPLPVTRLWGVGPVTAARLEELGIRTVGDLRGRGLDVLRARIGADEAEHFWRLAHGIDDRPVTPDEQARSIGHEQTFGVDVEDRDELRRVLLDQVEHVARRLRKHKRQARTVTLKIRFGDFQTITRSTTLDQPTDVTAELWAAARTLFDRWASQAFMPVRLLGMTASQLGSGDAQGDLFPDPKKQRQRRVDETVDQIAARFGKPVLRRGGAIEPPTSGKNQL